MTDSIHQGPVVCKTKSPSDTSPDKFLCSQPAENDLLNIALISVPQRHVVSVGNMTLASSKHVFLSYFSNDIGYTWSNPVLPVPPTVTVLNSTNNSLTGVSCDTATGMTCTAVGLVNVIYSDPEPVPLVYTSSNGGMSWNKAILPTVPMPNFPLGVLYAVTCDSTGNQCIAVGGGVGLSVNNIFALIYSHSNWSNPISPPPPAGAQTVFLTGVACNSTAQNCTAVGYSQDFSQSFSLLSYSTTDGGTSWSVPSTPAFVGSLNSFNGITCDTNLGTTCIAVGSNASMAYSYKTSDGGATWSGPTFLATPTGASGTNVAHISCDAIAKNCTTTGYATYGNLGQPISYTTSDGGVTWSNPILLTPVASTSPTFLFSVSCNLNDQQCVSVGTTRPSLNFEPVSYTSIIGGNWSTAIFPPAPTGATSVVLNDVSGSR
jgi:hypothetical protein